MAAPVATVAAAPVAYDHAMVASVPYSYLPYATNYGYQYATPAVAAPVAHTVHAATANVAYAAPAAVVHTAAAPVVHAASPVVHAAAAPVVHAAAAPVVHAAAPIVHAAAPVVTGSQYHAQDEAGQYAFGYNDLNSVRQETKTADGAVSGAYQYVDSDGLIQTVQYIADDAGFRVAGTNLPVFAAAVPADTPEVAAAKVQHAHAVAEANAIHAADAATYVAAAPVPVPAIQAPAVVNSAAEGYYGAANVYAAAPAVVAAAPAIVAAAPSYPETAEAAEAVAQYYGAANVYSAGTPVYAAVAPAVHAGIHSSPIAVASVAPVAVASADPVIVAPEATGYQYHSQDDIGQYSFGYADGNSGKQEIKTADGVVRGSYSYVDSDGIVQTVNYIADALGFRVGATNLPVHHVDAATAVAAEPAVAVAAAAPAVEVAAAPAMYPQVAYSYLPYAVNYGYHNAAPVAVAAAAPVTAEVAPVAVAAAPAVEPVAYTASAVPIVAAPAATVSSQFHAQDEFGAYSYGYNSPDQAKVYKYIVMFSREGKYIGLFITLVPNVGWISLGAFIEFWLVVSFVKLSVHTFQPLIVIYRRGNFVFYYWECTSIYRHCLIPLDPCMFTTYSITSKTQK